MNSWLLRGATTALVIGLVAVLSSGCVLPAGEYGYGSEVGYGLDYYEPYGLEFGGWGPDYEVAPYREGEHHPAPHAEQPAAHAYHAAPPSRSMPSIPSRSRPSGGVGRGPSGEHDGGGGHR